jgi:hypothetical protein
MSRRGRREILIATTYRSESWNNHSLLVMDEHCSTAVWGDGSRTGELTGRTDGTPSSARCNCYH